MYHFTLWPKHYIFSNSFVLIFAAPRPPQVVTVNPQSANSLSVSWTASVSDGVDGYKVTYSPVDGSCEGVVGGIVVVEGGSVMAKVVSGLQAYTEYSITVRARSVDGVGAPSVAQTGRTMAGGMLELKFCKRLI